MDAVVSLCRIGSHPILTRTDVEHVRVWLVDKPGANNNLHYVLDQAAREVLRLRRSGKRVLPHCVTGRSRTPAIAALYSHLAYGIAPLTALREVHRTLDGYWTLPNHPDMLRAVFELAGEQPPKKMPRPRRRARWRSLIPGPVADNSNSTTRAWPPRSMSRGPRPCGGAARSHRPLLPRTRPTRVRPCPLRE